MAVSSFLAEGAAIPQGSALTDMTKTSVMPEWYTNYAMDILSGQLDIANRPYTTAPMPRVAGFSDTTQQSFDMTGTAATAYQPGLTAATGATTNVLSGPGGLDVAQPYLTQAGQTSVSNIGTYMNPYNEAVTNRIGELGVRNLTENIMPQIEGRYIQAGQLGFGGRDGAGTPSGMMTETSRAVRDTSADILAQQAAALQAGYSEAAGLSNTDLNRLLTLASTAGGLSNADATRDLSAAGQLAELAAQEQALGLRGAGALGAVGLTKENKAQQNLDVAYADFLRQQGYPQEQINNMVNALKGVAGAVPQMETQYGISPYNVDTTKSSTTAANIAAAAAAAAGIIGGKKP